MKEAGAHAVKLEGGEESADSVKRILSAGVPVMGHLGLTPQSIYKFGTYTGPPKKKQKRRNSFWMPKLLEELGCFAIVLEKIPAQLTRRVSEELIIPTIGIGGGPSADGQVLVTQDMLGITKDFQPRFLRRYLELYELIKGATEQYIEDVKSQSFPNEKEAY